ncbi:C6orf136 [Branchiostoma lanceolatum]|uniref:C6orf136 protein n=1 Tax=Branchiostoma lanceolatum TaxID=7740 RepID=A0A8K0AC17_BRALA|nr:C6orf136 [Branchiostoma lanceolatum]
MAFQLRFLKPTCSSIVPRTSSCRVGRHFGSQEAGISEAPSCTGELSGTEVGKQACGSSGSASGHPQCTSGRLACPLPPCGSQQVTCTRLGTLVRKNRNLDFEYAGNDGRKSHRWRSVAKEHSPTSLMVLPDGTLLQPFIFLSPGKPAEGEQHVLKKELNAVEEPFLSSTNGRKHKSEKESDTEKGYFDSDIVNETISSLLAQFEDIFKDNVIAREVQKVTMLPSQQLLPWKQDKAAKSENIEVIGDMEVMMSVDVKKQAKKHKLQMTSDKKVTRPSDNRVTEEKLAEVRAKLGEQMPRFFHGNHDYGMYHPDVVFINDFLSMTTKGRTTYQAILTVLRMAAWLFYADVRLDVLKLTHEVQDGTVQARWRVHGLPLHLLMLRFWRKDKSGLYRSIDAFSVFTVGPDGHITRHHCSKMMPDPGKYRRVMSLWERIAGQRVRPAATLSMEPTSLSLTAPKVPKADGQVY